MSVSLVAVFLSTAIIASTEDPRRHKDEFLLHMRIEKKQARAVFDSRLRPF
jgi:hypothetical protein